MGEQLHDLEVAYEENDSRCDDQSPQSELLYRMNLDDLGWGEWSPLSELRALEDLRDGQHVLQVEVRDNAGNAMLQTVQVLIKCGQVSEIRETEVDSRDCSWQETGVSLISGDKVLIDATGEVVFWQSRDKTESAQCGPDGFVADTFDECYLAPGLPRHALVARIGSVGTPFFVGSHSVFVVPTSGPLLLGMNETSNCGGCADNQGKWNVTIAVARRSPEGG